MVNAARKTDMTEHGGTITGGSPNVMINGLPASRLTDLHSCPSDTDGFPHVGGPISAGSSTVFINNMAAARKGDGLVCIGSSPSKLEDEISAKHDRDYDTSKDGDKSFGKNKIDERRGPSKYQKDPLVDFRAQKDFARNDGQIDQFADSGIELGEWEYHASSSVDAEIRSIEDFRVSLNAVDVGAEGSLLGYDTDEHDFGPLVGKAEIDVLHGEAELDVGAHIDTKKKQAFLGASGEIGVAVIEVELTGETEKLRIPFTNWGIGVEGGVSGSLLTARLAGHAGVRFDPKKGFSARVGGKVGALWAGLGLDIGLIIAPMDPPLIPMDAITFGSSNVFIGE